jgi:hypothetical protein
MPVTTWNGGTTWNGVGTVAVAVAPPPPPPPPVAVAAYRDYQFLRILADLLAATDEFDEVRTGGLPELQGASAAADRLACLELAGWEDRDNYDDPDSVPQIRTVHYWLHLLVRAEDPDLRDDETDRLLAVAVNTLNGVALGATSYPNKSRLSRGHWLDAAGPERRMKVAGQFVYEVDDYSLHSTT